MNEIICSSSMSMCRGLMLESEQIMTNLDIPGKDCDTYDECLDNNFNIE